MGTHMTHISNLDIRSLQSLKQSTKSDHTRMDVSLGPCISHAKAQKSAETSPRSASWLLAPTKSSASELVSTVPANRPITWTKPSAHPKIRKAQLLHCPSKDPSVKLRLDPNCGGQPADTMSPAGLQDVFMKISAAGRRRKSQGNWRGSSQ